MLFPFYLVPSNDKSHHKAYSGFPRAFPSDIVLEVTKLLSPRDLSAFSLANSFCNDLANRQLWRTYRIEGHSYIELMERCDSLLRVPRRASYVLRLIVGPCTWTWNEDLVAKFSQVWQSVPRLLDLLLESPAYDPYARKSLPMIGGDFAPLMRGLIDQSDRLRLHVFKCDAWLRPDSLLLRFLSTQPSIKELIGVDVFTNRVPSLPPSFLPLLEVIVCHIPATAELLCRSRPIHTLEIRQAPDPDYDLGPFVDALGECAGTLTDVSLRLRPGGTDRDGMVRILERLSKTKRLRLRGFRPAEKLPFPAQLPMLEEMSCDSSLYADDPVTVNILSAQLGPSVRRISFARGPNVRIWHKDDDDEYVISTGRVAFKSDASRAEIFFAR